MSNSKENITETNNDVSKNESYQKKIKCSYILAVIILVPFLFFFLPRYIEIVEKRRAEESIEFLLKIEELNEKRLEMEVQRVWTDFHELRKLTPEYDENSNWCYVLTVKELYGDMGFLSHVISDEKNPCFFVKDEDEDIYPGQCLVRKGESYYATAKEGDCFLYNESYKEK